MCIGFDEMNVIFGVIPEGVESSISSLKDGEGRLGREGGLDREGVSSTVMDPKETDLEEIVLGLL